MSLLRSVCSLLGVGLLCASAFAQATSGAYASQSEIFRQRAQRPAQTGTITVTGVVVNAVTGEPISRALIQLQSMAQRVALTDSDGKFQFDNLPETQAMLTARKPGYYGDMELQQGAGRQKPIAITANMSSVTVKLTPAGLVAGRVTTADGEPVESARVRLKMRTFQNGRRQWNERGGASTDEDGVFRIGNLQPGTYYMYTDGSVRMISAGDEAIAPAYYPGVSDISGASPLEVRPGTTTVADLTLRKEKAYRVTGVVTGLQQGQSANVQLLGSGGESLPVQARVNSGGNAFELRRVPAGSYTLKVIAQQQMGPGMLGGFGGGIGQAMPRMPQTYTGSVPITVGGDLSGMAVALQPSATIPVVVRTDFTNKQTEGEGTFIASSGPSSGGSPRRFRQYVMLHLIRTDGQQGDNYAQMVGSSDNMSLAIQNIEPGRYRAEFMQMGGNTYVQSATFGTTDILREELVVSGGGDSQPINVVVRDDAASLSGTVNCSDVQCWVLVVPEGNSAIQLHMTFVNPQGAFQEMGLAPGSYRVYAFDRMDGIEYTNPEAMKTLGARAESVALSAGQKAQVTVELTKVADQ